MSTPAAERDRGGVRAIGRKAMINQFLDRLPVAHDKALETPLIAQDPGQGEMVARGRHAVETVECAHQGGGAGIDAGLVGGQVDVSQGRKTDLGSVVVAAALGGSVPHVMLETGRNPAGLPIAGSLKPAHRGGSQKAAQPRILPGPFGDASPARIAGNVHHRGENPVDAGGGRLGCGDRLGPLDELRIPGAGQPEGNRKRRAESVDRVEAEDQRNAEARILDGNALEPVARAGIRSRAEIGSHPARGDQGRVLPLGLVGHVPLQQLANAFRAAHALEQILHTRLRRLRGILIGVLDAVFVQVDPAGMVDFRPLQLESGAVSGDGRGLGGALSIQGPGRADADHGQGREPSCEERFAGWMHGAPRNNATASRASLGTDGK